ncbi:MAG: DUF6986 family protein [Gemmatimonadaceae bacterium]
MTSLPPDALADQRPALLRASAAFEARYPSDRVGRQPVHTLYVGAHRYAAGHATQAGIAARETMRRYAPEPAAFARVIGLDAPPETVRAVYDRVTEKLEREPVEDLRVDFEDGYGLRPDQEEDDAALGVAAAIADEMTGPGFPPFVGIRVKPLTEQLCGRSVRTLDLVLTGVMRRAGRLPDGFRITLPKVTMPEQVAYFASLLELLEERLGLAPKTLGFEMMVETPQTFIDANGALHLVSLLDASRGRMTAAHFGTYDYTAGCGIAAAHQRLRHPACDFARQMMQVALAGRGVWLSDGSTAILPVAPEPSTATPAAAAARASEEAVLRGWKLHFGDVMSSLAQGFYQGWDLHPAQLPTRFAAVFSHYLAGFDDALARLRALLGRAEAAGAVHDDPATGQALLTFLRRGVECGAFAVSEVCARSGLAEAELAIGSFAALLARRRPVER